MLELIAQATQPIDWTATIATWAAIATAAIVTGAAVIMLAISKFKEIREALAAAMQAQKDAASANAKADANMQQIASNQQHTQAVDSKLTDLALNIPTPEAIGRAMGVANKPKP